MALKSLWIGAAAGLAGAASVTLGFHGGFAGRFGTAPSVHLVYRSFAIVAAAGAWSVALPAAFGDGRWILLLGVLGLPFFLLSGAVFV